MGWKSSITLTRREAIVAIVKSLDKTPYDEMTNEQLEEKMSELNIGDDMNLPYYGYNFCVVDEQEDETNN